MFDLSGRRALITGASGGIGQAIAKAFITQGAEVIASGTQPVKLDALVAQLGPQVKPIACSLQNTDDVAKLFDQAEEQFGPIDTLVNNAGITRDGLIIRMKDEDWDEVFQVNLKAAFVLSRSAIKAMMKRRFGRLINITSVVATAGNPGQTNYCAAKAGMIGMSKALALEVATRSITVNNIAPGFIETAMTDKLNETQKEAILKQVPMQTIGTGTDIAAAALYLASQEAQYITGQTLHVNGGMYLV